MPTQAEVDALFRLNAAARKALESKEGWAVKADGNVATLTDVVSVKLGEAWMPVSEMEILGRVSAHLQSLGAEVERYVVTCDERGVYKARLIFTLKGHPGGKYGRGPTARAAALECARKTLLHLGRLDLLPAEVTR